MKTPFFIVRVRSVLFLALIVLFSSNAQSEGIDFKQGNWDKIVAMAKTQKKSIFLDAYASWCGPCKWMDKNIYVEATAGEFYNANFINVKIDMEKGEGPALAKKYGVKAYPTLLFINADGTIEHRVCGSMQLEDFIELGRTAMDPERRMKEAGIAFRSGKKIEPNKADEYFAMLDAGCADMTDDVNKYFGSLQGEELMQDEIWKLIDKYVSDYKSAAFVEMINHKTEFNEKFGSDEVSNKIKKVYISSLEATARLKDTTEFHKLKKEVYTNVGDEAEALILPAEMTRARKAGNWKSYADFANKYIEMYAAKDSRRLNEVAWTFYENIADNVEMKKAEDYARRSIEIKPEYGNMDTYAWVLFKNGNLDLAKEVANRAVELGKESGADTSDTEKIFEKLKK